MISFGKPNMLILNEPEFEGLPIIESEFKDNGILVDSCYSNISGLLFYIFPCNHQSVIYGLFRNKNLEEWENNSNILQFLFNLTNDNWNNELGSNSFNSNEEKNKNNPIFVF
jgi:hypothetical protein